MKCNPVSTPPAANLQDTLTFLSSESVSPLSKQLEPQLSGESFNPTDSQTVVLALAVGESATPQKTATEKPEIIGSNAPSPIGDQRVENTGLASSPLESAPPQARRARGANPALDNIWTRNHAVCMLGAICDFTLGGFVVARGTSNPLTQGIRPAAVADALLQLCPWIENSVYLNFTGSAALEKHTLRSCYKQWATNRVYYFYRYPERSEHPVVRAKANIRAAYEAFYYAFCSEISKGTPISEERAKAFWESVSDRVPFRSPNMAQSNH